MNNEETANTVGQNVAGVQIEHKADIYCPICAKEILNDETFEQVKTENPGHNHPQSEELGNVTAVLTSAEFDCPGWNCGQCGTKLDVRAIHYDSVCRPDWCPQMNSEK